MTHTGEIGMVKLLSAVKFHDGIRMEMICGKRVLDYLNMVNEQNHQISMKLSAKMDRTADAVQRLQDENFRMKCRLPVWKKRCLGQRLRNGKVQEVS